MIEENHENTPVRLVDTGIRTRDLPNASLVRYHEATSLGFVIFLIIIMIVLMMNYDITEWEKYRFLHGDVLSITI